MLIQENEKDNTELVEQSYSDTITLMNNIFKHLLPKGNYICRRRSHTWRSNQFFFSRKPTNWITIFTAGKHTYIFKRPNLKEFLDHCPKESHYFISTQKCRISNVKLISKHILQNKHLI